MTWGEWINSEYNTIGVYCDDRLVKCPNGINITTYNEDRDTDEPQYNSYKIISNEVYYM